MKESGFHSPWTGEFRDRLTAAAYLEAPAFLKYASQVDNAPRRNAAIFAADHATQPLTTVAKSAWIWTPFRWDPDELRVTKRRPGLRNSAGRLTGRANPRVAGVLWGTTALLGRRSRRRVLAATMLAILFALGVHLTTSGAELTPLSVSEPSIAGPIESDPTAKCDTRTDRLLYVAALDECVPAEW